MTFADELSMYYAITSSNHIDANTTYYHIPDSNCTIAIVCGDEQITISCKDLFRLLKWAYGQWGRKKMTTTDE